MNEIFTYSLEDDGQRYHHHPINNNVSSNNNNNNNINPSQSFLAHAYSNHHRQLQMSHNQYAYIPASTASPTEMGEYPAAVPQQDPQLSLICVIMNIWRLQSFLDNCKLNQKFIKITWDVSGAPQRVKNKYRKRVYILLVRKTWLVKSALATLTHISSLSNHSSALSTFIPLQDCASYKVNYCYNQKM